MSNEEVQPEMERESVITMGVSRTLSTAKFESIVIHQTIEEKITWKDLKERDKKRKNFETIFLQQYKESHDRILDELNLSHKKAYFVNHLDEKDNRPDPHADDDMVDIDKLDEL